MMPALLRRWNPAALARHPARAVSSGVSKYDDPATMSKNEANYQPLTPMRFLERSATTFPEHAAVQYGASYSTTYAELYDRTRQLASAVSQMGVGYGSTVAVMLNNTPQMLEAHYGVPMSGAVLNAINTVFHSIRPLFAIIFHQNG